MEKFYCDKCNQEVKERKELTKCKFSTYNERFIEPELCSKCYADLKESLKQFKIQKDNWQSLDTKIGQTSSLIPQPYNNITQIRPPNISQEIKKLDSSNEQPKCYICKDSLITDGFITISNEKIICSFCLDKIKQKLLPFPLELYPYPKCTRPHYPRPLGGNPNVIPRTPRIRRDYWF